MTLRTPLEDKALAWYAEKEELRPQLSSHPIYFFLNKEGKQVQRTIGALLQEFREWRQEQSKSKKRKGHA